MSHARCHALVVLLAILAGGCTLLPPAEPRPPQPRDSEVAPTDSEVARTDSEVARTDTEVARTEPAQPAASPASTMLLEQSRRERDAGTLDGAANSIERALRIDPDNPWLWLELGEIRMMEGDTGQAQEMARKALTLAGSDQALIGRADRLLAAIRSR